jgi:hypothetical protein
MPEADEPGSAVRRHGHAAYRHDSPPTTPIGSAIPHRHESRASLPSGRGCELPKEGSRAELCRQTTITGCCSQRADVHVQFVGQNLKRQLIVRWSLRLQRPSPTYDRVWRRPSARIPGTECLNGDAKSRRALRLGEAESCPDFPHDRCAWGHRSRRCHRSATDWKRRDCDKNRQFAALGNGPETARSISVGRFRPVAVSGCIVAEFHGLICDCANSLGNGAPAATRTRDPGLEAP